MNKQSTRSHILVVEDHPVFSRFLHSWLSQHYHVTTLSNGLDALRWLQEGNYPDAILLDKEMPRISGIQVLQNLRSSGLFSKLPVVMITAEDVEDTRRQCRNLDIQEVFPKPFAPASLLDTLSTLVNDPGRLQAA